MIQMKRLIVLTTTVLFLSASIFAGVVKKTKAEVSFKNVGAFSSVQTEKTGTDKKRIDADSSFKAKGVMGMAARAILTSGQTGEIIDLSGMTRYSLDHDKSTYRVSPIEKLSSDDVREGNSESSTDESGEQDVSETVKITRSEFRVDDTGETRAINNFETRKYSITWITEWENLETGRKGSDRLLTDVWATPLTNDLQKANEQEREFNTAYMKSMGFVLDSSQEQILGLNWLSLLGSLGEAGSGAQSDASQFSDEMNKIKGYPIVIDGKYYSMKEGGEGAQGEDQGNLKKMIGGLAKSALKRKSQDSTEEPSLTYYTELIELTSENLADAEFRVPSNYKQKGN
jgi:hypothetical protein